MIISLVSLLALGAQAIELANLTQILVDYEYKGVWRSNNGQNVLCLQGYYSNSTSSPRAKVRAF